MTERTHRVITIRQLTVFKALLEEKIMMLSQQVQLLNELQQTQVEINKPEDGLNPDQ